MSDSYGKRMVPEPILQELRKHRYLHYVTITYPTFSYIIVIPTNSTKDLTSDDIKDFIKSLPANAIYPVSQTDRAMNDNIMNIVYGIDNNGSANTLRGYQINFFTNTLASYSISIFTDYPIASQYYV